MRDEQGRHKQGEDVPRHSEVKSRKLDPATLDKGVDEIRDAFQAEDPDHSGRKPPPGLQRHDREQRKPGGDEIAISGRTAKSRGRLGSTTVETSTVRPRVRVR